MYNLTAYLPEHPSNPAVILPWCGKEANRGLPYEDQGSAALFACRSNAIDVSHRNAYPSLNSAKTFLEKTLHLAFELSLWCKGAFALLEIIAGVAAYFVPPQRVLTLVLWVNKEEFVEDPRDLVVNLLLSTVQHLPASAEKFAAIYLLGHGVIKLWLIAGLLQKRLWLYPAAMSIFGLFIVYQLYRYTFTHSVWLLLVTALDVLVIVLTWHEYRHIKSERRAGRSGPLL